MNSIPLDDDLKAKLGGLDQPVEVKDEHGRVIGTFVPQRKYDLLLAWWAAPDYVRERKPDGNPVPGKVIDDMLLERLKR